jgi:hypothetical protein
VSRLTEIKQMKTKKELTKSLKQLVLSIDNQIKKFEDDNKGQVILLSCDVLNGHKDFKISNFDVQFIALNNEV